MQQVKSKPVIVMKAKCDVCGNLALCAYVPQLDRWYCKPCIETVVHLLEILA